MGYEFMGYVRPDGQVGARNHVAVIPCVTCAGGSPPKETWRAAFPPSRKKAWVPLSKAAPGPSRVCWSIQRPSETGRVFGSKTLRDGSLRSSLEWRPPAHSL